MRRSARDLRVVVHDAEDAATGVAVTGQGTVAVDPTTRPRATVDELPDVAAATAIPRPVDARVQVELPCDRVLADTTSGRRGKRPPIGVEQQAAARIHRPPLDVDRPSEIVDRHPVRRAQWKSVRVDAWEARRVWTRIG